VILSARELDGIQRHAVREYPYEACGVILARGRKRRLLQCKNVQNQLHAREPQRYLRDARTAYSISTEDLRLIYELEDFGVAIKVIYHSHVDAQQRGGGTGAYFSETDKAEALQNGSPRYPMATYVVVSVVAGKIEAVAGFRWNLRRRDFTRVDLEKRTWYEHGAVLASRAWAWVNQCSVKLKERRLL